MEGQIIATEPCWAERFAIRFLADDPHWYEVGDSAAHLDSADFDAFRLWGGRLTSTGQWDSLGPPNAPGIAVYTEMYIIRRGPDGLLYFGGNFQNLLILNLEKL